MMQWTLVPATEFAAHADIWRRLNDASLRSPLLELEFVQPLLAQFGTGKELLASCTSEGEVIAMVIMSPRPKGAWETFQPSQAPIGLWLQRPGLSLQTLLDTLTAKLPGLPLVLGVKQVDPWLLPRPDPSASLQSVDYIQTARISIRGTFDEYWAARGKNLRANLKKQRARLLKEGISARMETSRAPEAMAQAVADFGRLESAGWKAQGGTAIHPDNAQGRFYRAMLEGFCRRGAASVIRYWFDQQLVAMDINIEGHGCVVVLKTTYDESVPSQYSPAFLMREESCQQLFAEHRFDTLEFYGKVMEWHTRWTDEVRTLYHVNCYRWPFLLQLHTILKNCSGRKQLPPVAAPAQAPAASTQLEQHSAE